jgi:hypothetical protein
MHRPARKHLAVFISLMLLLASCFISGCSKETPPSQLNETTKSSNLGFRPDIISHEHQALNFTKTVTDLVNIRFDTKNDNAVNAPRKNQILYVSGAGLNDKGEAKSWTFAVRYNNRTSIVTYDQHSRSIVDWTGNFSQREIELDSVIMPEDLFTKNRAAIIRDQEDALTMSRDLVLSMDNYTLTISGTGIKRVLVFDAETGALVRSSG